MTLTLSLTTGQSYTVHGDFGTEDPIAALRLDIMHGRMLDLTDSRGRAGRARVELESVAMVAAWDEAPALRPPNFGHIPAAV